jgi:hypothetical protein
VQAGDDRHVDVAGRPPPPSANSTTGSFCARAMPSMRSVFWWLRMPCVPASTVASYAMTTARERSAPTSRR